MFITVVDGIFAGGGDPAQFTNAPAMNVYRHLYDALVKYDNGMALQPHVAESWDLVDETTMQFTLRRDVFFHDGEPLTAEDVAYTFERLIDPDSELPLRAFVVPINDVEVIDEYTVQLSTPEPDGPLLSRVAMVPIVPKHYVESVGVEEFNRNPIGSGPYRFVESVQDSHITLETVDDYWGGRAENDGVIFRSIPEASGRFAALAAGDADIITNVPIGLISQVEANPELKMTPIGSYRNMFVGMNTSSPPLDDVRVRMALNYAIDKQGLIENLLGGHARYTGAFIGPDMFGYKDEISEYTYPYDPDKARSLLAEAGYADGLELVFEVPQGRYFMDAEIGEAIAAQLGDVGVDVTLRLLDWGTFAPRLLGDELEQLYYIGQGTLDADGTYRNALSSTGGVSYFADSRLDEAIAAQAIITDPEERLDALHELHASVLTEYVPMIFLWDQESEYAVRAELDGWVPRADEMMDLTTVRRSG